MPDFSSVQTVRIQYISISVCLVLIAKYVLRPLVKREEDYYD